MLFHPWILPYHTPACNQSNDSMLSCTMASYRCRPSPDSFNLRLPRFLRSADWVVVMEGGRVDKRHSGPPDTVLPWLEQQYQHVSTPHRGEGRGEGEGEKGDSGVREKVVFSNGHHNRIYMYVIALTSV